ncbi:MAG: hypothetical protein WBM15_05005 [Chromatiaceae bacterium]
MPAGAVIHPAWAATVELLDALGVVTRDIFAGERHVLRDHGELEGPRGAELIGEEDPGAT